MLSPATNKKMAWLVTIMFVVMVVTIAINTILAIVSINEMSRTYAQWEDVFILRISLIGAETFALLMIGRMFNYVRASWKKVREDDSQHSQDASAS